MACCVFVAYVVGAAIRGVGRLLRLGRPAPQPVAVRRVVVDGRLVREPAAA